MKKYHLLFALLLMYGAYAQQKPKKPVEKVKELSDTSIILRKVKYKDVVDGQTKGPKGEKVYIDSTGERYYKQGSKKIYLPTGPVRNKNLHPLPPSADAKR